MRRNPFADLRVLQLKQGVNNAMNYDRSRLKAALIRIKINVVVLFFSKGKNARSIFYITKLYVMVFPSCCEFLSLPRNTC